jgi:hypothetical protein
MRIEHRARSERRKETILGFENSQSEILNSTPCPMPYAQFYWLLTPIFYLLRADSFEKKAGTPFLGNSGFSSLRKKRYTFL